MPPSLAVREQKDRTLPLVLGTDTLAIRAAIVDVEIEDRRSHVGVGYYNYLCT